MASSSSAFRKLPPHVVRELKRHVSPKPLKPVDTRWRGPSPSSDQLVQDPRRLRWVLAGCCSLVATAASFPLVATWWISLNDKDDPLTAPQVRRGAFLNTGSRDVGRDPDWDFDKGRYSKDPGYFEKLFGEQDEKQNRRGGMPNQYMAMPPDKLSKHEQKMKDFAHGRARND